MDGVWWQRVVAVMLQVLLFSCFVLLCICVHAHANANECARTVTIEESMVPMFGAII
jgi:hypothetical protein